MFSQYKKTKQKTHIDWGKESRCIWIFLRLQQVCDDQDDDDDNVQ